MNDLIALLRAHTQPQHTRLENVTRLPRSLKSAEDLRNILVTFLGYYAALDPILHEASIGVLPSEVADRPWRSCALRQDLITMGLDKEKLDSIPICTRLPTTLTRHHIWGIHYVIEGSALGGKIVRSHLKKHPSLVCWHEQVKFFNIYGPDTASRWKSFIAELEKLSLSPADQTQVIEGAQAVFSTLTDWVQEQQHTVSLAD